jgi:DNA-binding transcriptional MerR regulator
MDRLRRTGMSIAEMREYTALVKQGSGTLKKRQALLSAHREQVRDMIVEWQLSLKLLDSRIDFYDEWVASGKRPAMKVPERAGTAPKSRPKEKRVGREGLGRRGVQRLQQQTQAGQR